MNWTPEIKSFIVQHQDDDTGRLLLSAHRYPEIDVPFAVDQILARKQIKNKLPEWFDNVDIIMGGRVPAEQCSSQQTAQYKRNLVYGDSICDLTGGMGVDLYYMSRGLSKAIYTERQSHLCEAAIHNFNALGADNIIVREGDGRNLPLPDVDTIYLDPARRATDGSRVYDLAECEPNVVEWQDELLSHCHRLVVKMSPMADISRVLALMPSIKELHIVAVKGECKEVIAVCEALEDSLHESEDVRVKCIDFKANETIDFEYYLNSEVSAESVFADGIGQYLYEPDVSVLKAGAYKSMCPVFDVKKLDVNSHLYTSERLVSNFPGRIFEVDETLDFSSKTLKTLKKTIPQANITARNFVMTADQLRNRSGIKDGGNVYIFASALKGVGNILVRCRKVLSMILVLCSAINLLHAKDTNVTMEQLLDGVSVKSPVYWHQGMEFYYLNESVSMVLSPEVHSLEADTVNYRGSIWIFDSIVSEEDWMGQQTMALRFISPSGKAYRFSTDRLMTQVSDTTYVPAISGMFPKYIIDEVNERLRAHSLYILINDERISDGDSIRFEKFVPIVVDSVSYGSELAPIEVSYRYEGGKSAFLKTSLLGSRENATSTPITKFFSTVDPFTNYPEIKPEIWKKIQHNEVVIDMTREECRLSWGKPSRFDTYNTKNGVVERWFYPGSRVLEFWEGRLNRIGREK